MIGTRAVCLLRSGGCDGGGVLFCYLGARDRMGVVCVLRDLYPLLLARFCIPILEPAP